MAEILSHTIFNGVNYKDVPYKHIVNSQEEIELHREKLLTKYLNKKRKPHHIPHDDEMPLKIFFRIRYAPNEKKFLG